MTGFITKKISHSRKPATLGSILKCARTKRNLTIEQAEKETRIPSRHLIALEEGNYNALPADAYNIGYVRNYAQFLKLNEEKILATFKEERSALRLRPLSGVALAPKRINDWRILITPRLIGTLAAIAIFAGIISYIYIQLQAFAAPPTISLKTPTQFTSTKDTTTLNGQTIAGAVVLVNSQEVSVTTNGHFSQQVQLSPGVNNFVIEAKNSSNKESQVAVQVLYTQQGVASLPQNVNTD